MRRFYSDFFSVRQVIDDIFCISFGFKGNWSCYLTCGGPEEQTIQPEGGAIKRGEDENGELTFAGQFAGLEVLSTKPSSEQMVYQLVVEEDPALAEAEEAELAEKYGSPHPTAL